MHSGFTHLLAEESLREIPGFLKIIEAQPQMQWIDSYQSFGRQSMPEEKKCLIYARKRGAWLKPFHCYSQNSEFQYYSLDAAEGCPFDCVYCYLQSYLNHGALVLFVNLDDLKLELLQLNQRNLWISTGLLTDSLISEKYFPILPEICNFLPEESVVEVRTKSDEIQCLSEPGIKREKIVVSWSLNPENVANQYEYSAAGLNARLQAAHNVMTLGYRIGFHFDPVFYFDGWRDAYQGLFESIQDFPASKIAFMSLGLFRYMPELGSMIRKRFPYHPILSGEFLPDMDGKYHYFREIRKEMYQAFSDWLSSWKRSVPIFWSMEPDERLLR